MISLISGSYKIDIIELEKIVVTRNAGDWKEAARSVLDYNVNI
jgi:hypothetical protein